MDISELLSFTKNSGASDLYLIAGCEPIVRIDGVLKRVFDAPALTRDEIHEMVWDVFTDEQKALFQERRELNFAIELEGVARFRVGCLVSGQGESASIFAVFSPIPEGGCSP